MTVFPVKTFFNNVICFSDKYIIYNTTKQNHCLHLNAVLPFYFFYSLESIFLRNSACYLIFSVLSLQIFPNWKSKKAVSTINLPLSSQFACTFNLIRISIFYISLLFTFLQVFQKLQTNYDYQKYFHRILYWLCFPINKHKKVKALVCVFKWNIYIQSKYLL